MATQRERDEFIKKHPNVVTREMPNSYESERALLGGMLIDGGTASKYLPQLTADDFYTPAHKNLYAAMNELNTSSRPIDIVTVVQQMESAGTLGLSGGVEYVASLVDGVPSVANSEHYFGIIKKDSRLRALIAIARQMADEAYALDPDENALARAESALYELSETGTRHKLEPITPALTAALDDIRARQDNRMAYRGVPTGFKYLDAMLGGGFQNSDLIILAARPGQGKTSFAMNCAVNAALARRPDTNKPYAVAVFSLEMSAVQLARRILCSVGSFDMSQVNRANVNERGWAKLVGAKARFNDSRLYIDETSDITPAEILSKCRALKHSVGLDLVVIDYLQLMHSGKNIDNMVQEIGAITRTLKQAAKSLSVPILLLSQMSRSIEKRQDPTPQLSDLRDSGAIEQDADIVLFLDRSAKTAQAEDVAADNAEVVNGNYVYLNVAKHRNGETGTVKLLWLPSTVTFSGIDYRQSEPEGGKRRGAFNESNDEPAPPDSSYADPRRELPDGDIGL